MRLLHEWLIDGGTEERSLGIEEFGVLFSQSQSARFVVRDDKVFERDPCRVVKLRPKKQPVTDVTSGVDVDIEILIDPFNWHYFTSQAAWGKLWLGTAQDDPSWGRWFYLVRSPTVPRRYAIVEEGEDPSALFAQNDQTKLSNPGLHPLYIAWDSMFLVRPASNSSPGHETLEQIFVAGPGPDGEPFVELYTDGTLNKYVLAFLRQRSINIEDFP